MKIRYVFVTILTIGVLLYSSALLVWEMAKALQKPVSPTTLVQVANTVATTAQLTTPTDSPTTTIPATTAMVAGPSSVNQPIVELQQLLESSKKYTSVKPSKWGEDITGMVYSVNMPEANGRVLFLTFNAYIQDYPALFDLLITKKIKSTLFLTGAWVRRNAAQAKRIGELAHLFEIENHGNKNIALSVDGATAYGRKGTGSLAEAMTEVSAGYESVKTATGQQPVYVRPFLNYADNVVVAALADASIKTIGFTLSGDGGGLFSSETIKNQILDASNGAIILLTIDPDYPNILKGLQLAVDEIEQQKLPIRFEQLNRYESYFEYVP